MDANGRTLVGVMRDNTRGESTRARAGVLAREPAHGTACGTASPTTRSPARPTAHSNARSTAQETAQQTARRTARESAPKTAPKAARVRTSRHARELAHGSTGQHDGERTSVSQARARRGKSALRAVQATFAFRGRGGARIGAGRKPKGARAGIPHRARAEHSARHPVQMTMRLRAGLPSLRRAPALAVLHSSFDAASARPEFRVVHHSVQSNHLHLIVEAADRGSLSAGMRALLVRIARGLNRLWLRAGGVFADRFHERALRTPLAVRNSLVYVLQNARKHGILAEGPDPCSSGPWFHGWKGDGRFRAALEQQRARIEDALRKNRTRDSAAGARPRDLGSLRMEGAKAATWLLRAGWMRGGLLGPREWPRGATR